jgi:hypothetical protein
METPIKKPVFKSADEIIHLMLEAKNNLRLKVRNVIILLNFKKYFENSEK